MGESWCQLFSLVTRRFLSSWRHDAMRVTLSDDLLVPRIVLTPCTRLAKVDKYDPMKANPFWVYLVHKRSSSRTLGIYAKKTISLKTHRRTSNYAFHRDSKMKHAEMTMVENSNCCWKHCLWSETFGVQIFGSLLQLFFNISFSRD